MTNILIRARLDALALLGESPGPNRNRFVMPSLPSVAQQAINVRQQATQQKIDVALARKSLDVQQQTGDAINELLQQAAILQQQLAEGRIDVRV